MQRKLVITRSYLIEDEDKLIAAERQASIGLEYIAEDGEERVVTAADYDEEGLAGDELLEARRDWMTAAAMTLHRVLSEQDQDRFGLTHMHSMSSVEALDSRDRFQIKLWGDTQG